MDRLTCVITNTLAPYASQLIGETFGHGDDKNTAAQLASHAILGAVLAYSRGGTKIYYDKINNVSVITNSQGKVVTVNYSE